MISINTAQSVAQVMPSATPKQTTPALAENKIEATKTTLSGKAIMLSRLFGTNDLNANPKVEYQLTILNASGSGTNFLTLQDRDFLAKVYEYADAKGIDFQKVDYFAFDLVAHRQMGGAAGGLREGVVYDTKTKERVEVKFTASDEALALDILKSKAFTLADSEVDHEFLEGLLNPYSRSHIADFNFLKEIVFAFSSSGDEVDPNAKPIRKTVTDFPPWEVAFAEFDKIEAEKKAGESAENKGKGVEILEKRLFGQGASKAVLAGYLNDNDKSMLGALYAKAIEKGASEEDLKRIDKKAYSLAAMRMKAEMMQSYWEKDAAFKSKMNEANTADKSNKSDDKTLGKTHFPLAESYGKSFIFAPFATISAAEEKSSSIKENKLKKDAP